MNPLVVRTAFPFGYLLAFGALLGLGVLGLALLAAGARRRRPGWALVGALATAFAGYVFWVNVSEGDALDLSPPITAPGQLAGRWAGTGGAALELTADGAYRCAGGGECEALGRAGTWARQADNNVAFRPVTAGPAIRYRVVRYHGRLRLAHPFEEDPDLWDGELPFERVAPAA